MPHYLTNPQDISIKIDQWLGFPPLTLFYLQPKEQEHRVVKGLVQHHKDGEPAARVPSTEAK